MDNYRITVSQVIAFDKTMDMGEIVKLTTEQADALREVNAIEPYEVKIMRPVKGTKKKPARSSQPGRASQSKTRGKRTKATR